MTSLAVDCRIDEHEMLSYLGGLPDVLEESERARIAGAIADCQQACTVTGTYRAFEIAWPGSTPVGSDPHAPIHVKSAGMELPGHDIARHLAGAHGVVISVVTLGLSSEAWLKRQRRRSLERFVLGDAAASAYVEAGADALEASARRAIEGSRNGRGRLGPRYSPGYGDLPLDVQGPLLAALDAERLLGIHLTEEGLMIPTKSITAIAGVFEGTDVDGARDGIGEPCEACPDMGGCSLRRKGRRCYGR